MTQKVTATFLIVFALYLVFIIWDRFTFKRLLYAMGKSIKSLLCTSLFLHLTFYNPEFSWCSQSRLHLCFREKERKQVTVAKARI